MNATRTRFLLLAAAVVAARAWFMTTLPLTGDEAYHWEWSRHLAAGYHDHPPMTAYVIRLSTALFGRSNHFTVRLPALLLMTGTAALGWLLARRLARQRGADPDRAERAGWVAALLIAVLPLHAGLAVYMSTDPPVVFFWTLTLYLLICAFDEGRWLAWIGAGLAMGLALTSKFLCFFLLPAVGLFVLLSAENRRWLLRPHPYVAALCGLVLWVPFLRWNAANGWPTFLFNFQRREVDAFAPWHILEYAGSQAGLVLTPGIAVLVIALLGHVVRNAWRKREVHAPLLLMLSAIVPLAYFFTVSLRRTVGLHWTATAWIGPVIYLAVMWDQIGTPDLFPRLRCFKTGGLAFAVGLTLFAHLAVHVPASWVNHVSLEYASNPEKFNTKANAERFGWREMGHWVARVRAAMLEEQGVAGPGVFLLGGRYGVSAAISFYTPSQPPTHLWAPVRSCGEHYRYWTDFETLKGKDAVFVAKRPSRVEEALPSLRDRFDQVGEPEELPIVVDGAVVGRFALVRCHGFHGVAPDFSR